jgi:Cof subfamily protein (haloacid dehalogenase superfamily)
VSNTDQNVGQIDIVFTDVDGTLVDNEHHPMPDSAPMLQRVAGRVPLCLVSARSPEGLYPIQRALGFTGPLACFSGAYVLDHEGNELYSSVIPTADALAIKRWIGENLPDVLCASYGFHDWIVDDRSDPRIVREEYFVQAPSRECSDLEGVFGERGVHKFLLMGEPESIVRAQRVVSERYPGLTAVRSNDILCEVMSRGASKRRAVELLCERYGVLRERSVAFGDGPNDIDMLQAAGRSFAMANAEDAVKRAATDLCPWSNVELGVARTLDQLFA